MIDTNEKLPKGWVETTLGETFKIERGGSPRPIENYITENENGINWIKIGDTKNVNKYIYSTREKIIPEGLKKSRMVFEDDFILSNSMSFGRPYIMKTRGCIHDGWLVIRKNENIDNNFLYYLLSSNIVFKQFSELAKGSTVKNLNIQAVQKVKINIPPLKIQLQISSKLDQLFAHLEIAKKGLEKIPTLLKEFRQAVLTQAFSTSFKRVFLSECTIKIQDGAHNSPKNQYSSYVNGLYPYITSKNIRNNYMDLSNIVYVEKDYHDSIYSRCKPELGDVLLTKDGANTGNVTLNTFDQEFSLLSSVCLIKVNKEKLFSSYLKYYIQSPEGLNELLGEMSGTAIKRIVLHKIKNTQIPLPSLEEQTEIVRRVEALFAKADAIEERYKSLKEKIEQLPQAILGKAFRGEL